MLGILRFARLLGILGCFLILVALAQSDVLAQGADTDGDGIPNVSDPDDDNDGVGDAADVAPLDPHRCRDFDADTCDDCTIGTDGFGPLADNLPGNDGPDADADGLCDAGDPGPGGPDTDGDGIPNANDPDDDNDGVGDAADVAPLDPHRCRDIDTDTCDDCTIGTDGFGPQADTLPGNDGPDADADGLCDAGDPGGGPDTDGDGIPNVNDPDDDNDGVGDAADVDPLDPHRCRDIDADTCDDCTIGTDGFGPLADNLPGNDGPDANANGLCDAGDPGGGPDADGDGIPNINDPDDDNDGVGDAADVDPLDPDLCRDIDSDTCDDCTIGTDGFGPLADNLPGNDGPDADADGLCDAGDPCPLGDPDGDLVCDPVDNCPNHANAGQADADGDGSGDVCDCGPLDQGLHPGAPEINDGQDNQCPGDVGYGFIDEIDGRCAFTNAVTFCWPHQPGATQYRVLRTAAPPAADCATFSTADSCIEDPSTPAAGAVSYYYVQATQPNTGSWGGESDGDERFPVLSLIVTPLGLGSGHAGGFPSD